jgi:hypothetical protein
MGRGMSLELGCKIDRLLGRASLLQIDFSVGIAVARPEVPPSGGLFRGFDYV